MKGLDPEIPECVAELRRRRNDQDPVKAKVKAVRNEEDDNKWRTSTSWNAKNGL